jgi:Phage tail tube protein, GTA-gp10
MSPAVCLTAGNCTIACRPSYKALVAAEDEVGSLFALVERASSGALKLSELIAVLWHCRADTASELTRDYFAASCVDAGLAHITPVFRQLMEQALGGS